MDESSSLPTERAFSSAAERGGKLEVRIGAAPGVAPTGRALAAGAAGAPELEADCARAATECALRAVVAEAALVVVHARRAGHLLLPAGAGRARGVVAREA